ncbi:hypothetical protein FC19_GL001432 [Liquorilactobacillus aquaticus DSM 21051]|uniref:Calcineurin-like phosphoesterase domain-containing protein n=1 Tax=Liquorilactobacillus aquaticus DSM 21051 TaxID=1423725 RepID=A0A0R2CVR7_9LACO|nr:metallophosphoesterase [Liquorilactobacillus aquaticus]KRM95951.1 hypothetical protein FC19_GL001432 [Liquorilactobacillus aquaticus DSM 21051]
MGFKWPPKLDLTDESNGLQDRNYRNHMQGNWNTLRWWYYHLMGYWSSFWNILTGRLDDQDIKISALENKMTSQAIQNTNNTEVVDSRTNAKGKTFNSLGERLNNDTYSKDEIDTMIDYVSLDDSIISDYTVDGVVDSLKSFAGQISTSSNFKCLLLQDEHFLTAYSWEAYENFKNAGPLVYDMLANMAVFDGLLDSVVVNGDNIDGGDSNVNQLLLKNRKVASIIRLALSHTDVFVQLGNHDDGTVFNTTPGKFLTRSDVLKLYNYDAHSFGETRSDFDAFKDYNDKKVRLISLNTYNQTEKYDNNGNLIYSRGNHSVITQKQLTFVVNALASVPNGYAVLIVTHCPLQGYGNNKPFTSIDSYPYNTNHDLLNGVLQAYAGKTTYSGTGSDDNFPATIEADFSKSNGDLAGVVVGHEHSDMSMQEIDGVKLTERCCFIPSGRVINGTKVNPDLGTIDQYAFDIIEIDTTNRQVIFKRFGQGSDYSYGY